MINHKKPMNINTRLLIVVGAVLIVSAIIVIALVNYSLRQNALAEAEEKARITLERNLATHLYFSKQMKPKLFELTQPMMSKDYFEPSWMSSTYAVREIDNYYKSLNNDEYYYKECAINARNIENEADEYEKAFIKRLNREPDFWHQSDVRTIDGKLYFTILRRGEVMEAGCLKCHSTPENAPADMVKIYGPERSFNRNVGEIVSAISIRIPIFVPRQKAMRLTTELSAFFLLAFLFLLAIQFWFNRKFILSPINRIREKAFQITRDESVLGEEIALSRSKELNELITSFNVMSAKLCQSRELLSDRVEERTRELYASNENLRQEIDEHKQTAGALQQSDELLRAFMDSATEAFLLWDAEWLLAAVNEAGINLFFPQKKPETVVGKHLFSLLPDIAESEKYGHFLKVVNTGEPILIDDILSHPDLGSLHLELRAFRVGKGFGMTAINITDRKRVESQIKASLKEKETLLQEIHHRVKNNLTVISSLLKLQMATVPDESALEALQDSQSRVHTMSMIHEALYRSDDLSSIDMHTYLSKLGDTLLASYAHDTNIALHVASDNIILNVNQASPLGLVVNELITNSLKYAFPDNGGGDIYLNLHSVSENGVELTIHDNGIGIPDDFDLQTADSLGFKLVKAIVENQLDGSIAIENNNGTRYLITFAINET